MCFFSTITLINFLGFAIGIGLYTVLLLFSLAYILFVAPLSKPAVIEQTYLLKNY